MPITVWWRRTQVSPLPTAKRAEVLQLAGEFDRLAGRDRERADPVGVALHGVASGPGQRARALVDLAAEELDDGPPLGLLPVADADHEHRALQAELLAGIGERRAPLAGAGAGDQVLHAGLLVVVGLRNGAVELVAAGNVGAFVLVVDARRSPDPLLEPVSAAEQRRPVARIELPHRRRNLDVGAGRVVRLLHQRQGLLRQHIDAGHVGEVIGRNRRFLVVVGEVVEEVAPGGDARRGRHRHRHLVHSVFLPSFAATRPTKRTRSP